MVPSVAVKLTGVGGTVFEGISVSEFCVRSAATVDMPFCGIEFGAALTPSTGRGLAFRLAAPVPPSPFGVPLHPAPPVPGPKLQPHQLSPSPTVV